MYLLKHEYLWKIAAHCLRRMFWEDSGEHLLYCVLLVLEASLGQRLLLDAK